MRCEMGQWVVSIKLVVCQAYIRTERHVFGSRCAVRRHVGMCAAHLAARLAMAARHVFDFEFVRYNRHGGLARRKCCRAMDAAIDAVHAPRACVRKII